MLGIDREMLLPAMSKLDFFIVLLDIAHDFLANQRKTADKETENAPAFCLYYDFCLFSDLDILRDLDFYPGVKTIDDCRNQRNRRYQEQDQHAIPR